MPDLIRPPDPPNTPESVTRPTALVPPCVVSIVRSPVSVPPDEIVRPVVL